MVLSISVCPGQRCLNSCPTEKSSNKFRPSAFPPWVLHWLSHALRAAPHVKLPSLCERFESPQSRSRPRQKCPRPASGRASARAARFPGWVTSPVEGKRHLADAAFPRGDPRLKVDCLEIGILKDRIPRIHRLTGMSARSIKFAPHRGWCGGGDVADFLVDLVDMFCARAWLASGGMLQKFRLARPPLARRSCAALRVRW